MSILEVNLDNPIDLKSIDDAMAKIHKAQNYDFLVFDVGKHNFESIESLKYLKNKLLELDMSSLCFTKAALIHPKEYPHEKSGSVEYDFFTSKVVAQEWLTS